MCFSNRHWQLQKFFSASRDWLLRQEPRPEHIESPYDSSPNVSPGFFIASRGCILQVEVSYGTHYFFDKFQCFLNSLLCSLEHFWGFLLFFWNIPLPLWEKHLQTWDQLAQQGC